MFVNSKGEKDDKKTSKVNNTVNSKSYTYESIERDNPIRGNQDLFHSRRNSAAQMSIKDLYDKRLNIKNKQDSQVNHLSDTNHTGMPDSLKSSLEGISGFSMNDVRVHYNSENPIQLHALAYTQGSDIYISAGQEKYLGHEAWHVVQQKQGRVKPTTKINHLPVNANPMLESEADLMGAKTCKQSSSHLIENVQQYDNVIQGAWSEKPTEEEIDQVNEFVDGLKRTQFSFTVETREEVFRNAQKMNWEMPVIVGCKPGEYRTRLTVLYLCENCQQFLPYEAMHLGHKTEWKRYLKEQGVKSIEEAKIRYNDVVNLRTECATCNTGHAFEKEAEEDEEESEDGEMSEDWIVSDQEEKQDN